MAVMNGAFTRTNLAQSTDGVYPRFFIDSVQDMLASEREGRPIFHDEERIEFTMPGNPYNRPVHRVTDEHRQRFAREYEAFRKGIELAPEGTPLEEWPVLKRSQVMELKGLGFSVVEQIAEMDDRATQLIGTGGPHLRTRAQVFLDEAKRLQVTEQMTAQNARFEAENMALRRQVEELGSRMESMHSQLQTFRDAPNPVASAIPMMSDPVELAKQGKSAGAPPIGGESSFASMGAPRKRPLQPPPTAGKPS